MILFGWPFRRIRVKVTASKSPEKSIQHIYSIMLETIEAGWNTEEALSEFLGLQSEDFLLQELYFLRDQHLLDVVSNTWMVTPKGQEFIKDNNVLQVIEEDEFEFLVDARQGNVLSYEEDPLSKVKSEHRLKPLIDPPNRASSLLDNTEEAIRTLYKQSSGGKSYIIDIFKNQIQYDKLEYRDYLLLEYVPEGLNTAEAEPFIEVRDTKGERKMKLLSEFIQAEYPDIIYQLTESDRKTVSNLGNEKFSANLPVNREGQVLLTVWETQNQFKEAIKTTQNRLFIESPWIKKATLRYIPLFENLLEGGKNLTILYGIHENDEHHIGTLKKLEHLKKRFVNSFHLIHLPSHFAKMGIPMTGTHRKLLIKDEDYFLTGSFNFLSFNKREGDKVANEESILVREGVREKWRKVVEDYQLQLKL